MNALLQIKFRDQTGSALVAVMGVVLLMSLIGAGMVALGRQQVFTAERMRDYVKARMIAEAGVNDAYNLMKTNFEARLNAANFPKKDFDTPYGAYDAEVVTISSNTASIISTGSYRSATAIVRADIKKFDIYSTNGVSGAGSSGGAANPFGFAILAGGDLGWVGNSDMETSNGVMHCNGSYSANGINTVRGNVESCMGISLVGNATITGAGSAPSISGSNIGTPMVGPVPVVPVPNIDLTPYYNAALAKGQVYNGAKSISGNVSPNGGIMWVNGSLNIGNGVYNGCFIATGGVELKTTGNGTITMTNSTDYPLLVSRDASILIKQAKTFTFDGLIYAKTGNFDKQGNGDVFGRGAIIAAGNVSKNGGWSGLIFSDPTPAYPGTGGSSPDLNTANRVIITAWQD